MPIAVVSSADQKLIKLGVTGITADLVPTTWDMEDWKAILATEGNWTAFFVTFIEITAFANGNMCIATGICDTSKQ